jgi:holo-[acyl-carrier protein] synthase
MVGIDIIKIDRIEKFIKKFGKKGLQRFLSENEIEISKNNMKRVAGFWAVKEAISKSLKVGIGREFSFHDVEITKNSKGTPIANLSEKIIENFSVADISISITHDGDYAVAVAIVEIQK